jgi:predicted nucleotidyltransferase
MDYLDLSERFMADRFPTATVAVVAGSTARGTRTASSDIDLLLIGDDLFTGDSSSLAATYEFENEVFEVFAYTCNAFEQWALSGVAQNRPVIVHMLLEGVALRGGQPLTELRDSWRGAIAAGPVVSQHELDMRRYAITDLLDDLRDSADLLERNVIAFTLFNKVAELVLLSNRRWIGTGKYLPRRLRDFDNDRADSLSVPLLDRNLSVFADAAEHELNIAGGRVQGGFVRQLTHRGFPCGHLIKVEIQRPSRFRENLKCRPQSVPLRAAGKPPTLRQTALWTHRDASMFVKR